MTENRQVKIVRARAPLRLGLAGGGTDVSPYCDEFGGYVLNATIDRYAYAVISLRGDDKVCFEAADHSVIQEFELDNPIEPSRELLLHNATYRRIINQYHGGKPIPLTLTTYCDAPPGSGLGSSSTVVVAMVKAFAELLNLPMDDYTIAHQAFEIERVDCGLKGGRQDQYTATFGGFNFMEFYANDRAVINQLRIKHWIICELEASLLLYYTGVSRESARIIEDQSRNIAERSVQSLDAMHALKMEAQWMKECLFKGDFSGIVDSMRMGWENKKRSAASVSSPQIEATFEAAVEAGALAGKVSGAGGGGFMMFFVPPEKRMHVIHALNHSGQVSNCHFTQHGSQAWRT